mmetsp:Transcript_48732/g.142107  ORF Transcript_48732/g.142107 Transcript_48732/m.142107 type:complete len:222 (-) Transcript_48732:1790-2455(-)
MVESDFAFISSFSAACFKSRALIALRLSRSFSTLSSLALAASLDAVTAASCFWIRRYSRCNFSDDLSDLSGRSTFSAFSVEDGVAVGNLALTAVAGSALVLVVDVVGVLLLFPVLVVPFDRLCCNAAYLALISSNFACNDSFSIKASLRVFRVPSAWRTFSNACVSLCCNITISLALVVVVCSSALFSQSVSCCCSVRSGNSSTKSVHLFTCLDCNSSIAF